ncbi:hypothetical protein [Metasolibacillus sp. FSL K6-0083]|uniref:hypothetical protein n=1 Tax=Metasolibacillus sp. FSL K6-0083 TaxID=2921416 RepID=UPI00315AB5C8
MKTIIIYDYDGYTLQNLTGEYRLPAGIPYLEVTLPEGKRLKPGIGVDVTKNPHQPIFEDIPKSETELLKDELHATKLALAELAESVLGGA